MRQPVAVILNGEADVAAGRGQTDFHMVCAGMAGDVGKGFLRDAEEVGFGFVGKTAGEG